MIRDTFSDILDNKNVRQNLIQLKAELKISNNKVALLYQMGGDYSIFQKLIRDEDPKVRKNTALIMGELGVPSFLDVLYEGYLKEEQLFVKSSYLTAMKDMDYSNLIPELKKRLEYLTSLNIEESDKKHINEEIRTLTNLVLKMEGTKSHLFTGYHIPSTLCLLTNRNFKEITLEQLKSHKAKEFNAGVIVNTNDLSDILEIRTFSELLFMLEDVKSVPNDINLIADLIANSSLLDFMLKRHKEKAPFYFRIELKSKMDLDKKSSFTKKLSSEIERLTNRNFINTTSNYEFELRLIENKEGNFNVLIKLFTLKDERFHYRKEVVASSIQPVNAALIAALAKSYLVEDGQVLDPFCGVGTMLIERHKLVNAKTMYGLDIYGEAIEKAKINAKEANPIIHFINRDFFDFKHEYLFDEIFTNMPRVMGHKDEDEINHIYQRFFLKAHEHLKEDGIIVMYSHSKENVRRLMNPKKYKLLEELEISKKEGAYLYIIMCIK